MPEHVPVEELPAGPTEGGGGFKFPRRPGIAELPAGPPWEFGSEAVTELFHLRNRVHAIENQLLATRLIPHRPVRSEIPRVEALRSLPNELPEGGEGGGGFVPRPWPEIAELPPWEQFAALTRDLAIIAQRLTAIEVNLAAINAKVGAAN